MKTMVITGASSGIGKATAKAAKAAGYRVALAARSADKLEALVKELGGEDHAIAVTCDVQKLSDLEALMQTTLSAFGSIDAVFANAGLGSTASGTGGGEPDNWEEMVMTNLYGVMLTCKAALPEIKKSKGHIVITSSIAGRRTLKGSIYGATKWGVTGYGKNLREEVKEDGVRVTLIEPGMVKTPFFSEEPDSGLEPENIADGVIYAVSQPASVNVLELVIMPN